MSEGDAKDCPAIAESGGSAGSTSIATVSSLTMVSNLASGGPPGPSTLSVAASPTSTTSYFHVFKASNNAGPVHSIAVRTDIIVSVIYSF